MQHEMQYGKINDTSVEYNKQEYGQQAYMAPVIAQPPYPQPMVATQSYIVQNNVSQFQDQQRIHPMPQRVQPINGQIFYLSTADGHPYPIQIQCPYCNRVIVTHVTTQIGPGTCFIGFLLILIFWPLFWLPCCLEDCKDRVHICTNCGHQVGKKKYIF